MSDIDKEMHDEIINFGKKVWCELYNKPREPDVVGELYKTTINYKGDIYSLNIDCYWDRSKYFDYHVKGNGIDYKKLVAHYM